MVTLYIFENIPKNSPDIKNQHNKISVLNERNTVYTFYLISWATSNIYQINSKGLW